MLLECISFRMTVPTIHMPMGPMIEAGVPQPDRRNVCGQHVGNARIRWCRRLADVVTFLAPGRNRPLSSDAASQHVLADFLRQVVAQRLARNQRQHATFIRAVRVRLLLTLLGREQKTIEHRGQSLARQTVRHFQRRGYQRRS